MVQGKGPFVRSVTVKLGPKKKGRNQLYLGFRFIVRDVSFCIVACIYLAVLFAGRQSLGNKTMKTSGESAWRMVKRELIVFLL